jgi:formate/nitrite transporter FocA (FNT family)
VDASTEQVSAAPLARRERRRARARSALGPHVVHEAIRLEGAEELARPASALLFSGVAAGLSMGFSLVAEGVLQAALPVAPWSTVVAKLGYSFGFLFVILGRQQLFTENTLTVILPLMHRPDAQTFARVARLWALVLAANLAGAFLFAASLAAGDLFPAEQRAAFLEIARRAASPPFHVVLARGIYGGWLIALMVWLLPAARSARFFVIVTVTWLVGAAELSHVVAGTVEVLYLVVQGELPFGRFLIGFLLPAFLGNSIGGVSLVAALNHAQVVAGRGRAGEGTNGR